MGATQHAGKESTELKTLLEDGTIIGTESSPFSLVGVLARHGVPHPPESGNHWKGYWSKDLPSLVEAHRARVAEARRTTAASVVPGEHMDVYFAMRLRSRELADRAYPIRVRVAGASFWVGLAATAALIGWPAMNAWNGRGSWSAVALAGMFAVWIPFLAPMFGMLVLGPTVARRRREPKVPAAELLEHAKVVAYGEVPAPTLPVFLPDAPELGEERTRQLEQRDVRIFALEAAGPLLLMGGLGSLSIGGVLIGMGLDWLTRGVIALRYKQARLAVMRRWWVGELVDSEPVEVSAACPLVSPAFAWLDVLVGIGFAAVGVHAWVTRPASAQASFAVIVLVLGAAILASLLAARRAARRHSERRKALAARLASP
jgi:hypothetical protein